MSTPATETDFEAWRRGDDAAAERLFEAHFDAIYDFFAAKIQGEVHDLVQRTFLGCLEARSRWPEGVGFRAYLFGIARHELFAHYRARTSHTVDFTTSSLRDLAAGPSTLNARKELGEALVTALTSLPLDDQCLLELRYVQALSGPELAAIFTLPEGTIRTRLRTALRRLREAIEPRADARVELPDDDALEAWARSLAPYALPADARARTSAG